MDQMKILDKEGNLRYTIEPDNEVVDARTCDHRFIEGRCKFCNKPLGTAGELGAEEKGDQ